MALTVVPATGVVLERILDDTYPLWHDGLSREGYGKLWAAQLKTPWGATHLDRVALQDGAVVGSDGFGFATRADGTHPDSRRARPRHRR